jgi:hypothetical protein
MTALGSATGRYQLVILGHDGDQSVLDSAERLDRALGLSLSHLGVNTKKFLAQIPSGASASALDRRLPSVAVFFGAVRSPKLSSPDADRLAKLLIDGVLVIPIVEDMGQFREFVPPQIAHLNGISFSDCGADFERLAARVLEGFGLLRETRRLFISYRRSETSGVAAQLYEALDASGFDVFLDTHGTLRPGEPFQDILWHRLADTDVAVILDSPGFLVSRWTDEELARANTSNIQILQVLWPGQQELAPAAFSTFQPLSPDDFEDAHHLGPTARLRAQAVSAIIDAVEGLRARAIGARHTFLVREFVLEARNAGFTVYTTLDRTIVIARSGGQAILVQPAVGVPDAVRYETLDNFYYEESARGRKYAVPPILLYDQTGIRARWLEHLKWLNGNLTHVRSLSLTDAKTWLAGVTGGSSVGSGLL